MAIEINWLAVIVGVIGYQALGALWYGALFSDTWMDAMGYDSPEDVQGEDSRTAMIMTTVGSLVATVSLAVLLELAGATTWQDGLLAGALVGIGILAAVRLQSVGYEALTWRAYGLSAGYNAIALAGIGVLLAVW